MDELQTIRAILRSIKGASSRLVERPLNNRNTLPVHYHSTNHNNSNVCIQCLAQ